VALVALRSIESNGRDRLHLAVPPKSRAILNPNAVSPDGQRIALIMAMEASQVPRLFVRRLDSLELTEIPGSERGVGPFWSPDSGQIAFWKLGVGGLMKVNVAGGAPQLVCKECLKGGGAEWFGATWSATNVIAFSEAGKLFRVPARGRPSHWALVPETGRYWPSSSPTAGATSICPGPRPDADHVGAFRPAPAPRGLGHTPPIPPGYWSSHDAVVAN
jgi:Tol biopolymer transport system component